MWIRQRNTANIKPWELRIRLTRACYRSAMICLGLTLCTIFPTQNRLLEANVITPFVALCVSTLHDDNKLSFFRSFFSASKGKCSMTSLISIYLTIIIISKEQVSIGYIELGLSYMCEYAGKVRLKISLNQDLLILYSVVWSMIYHFFKHTRI